MVVYFLCLVIANACENMQNLKKNKIYLTKKKLNRVGKTQSASLV